MTIKNYTFFSPSGTEFPVSATADRRLYLMLGGMNYADYKMKHWVQPVNSGFNRIYKDTSFVVAGAYFESDGGLRNERLLFIEGGNK